MHWPVVSVAPRPDAEHPRQPLRAAVLGSLLAHGLAFALLPPFSSWHFTPPGIPAALSVSLGNASASRVAAAKPIARHSMPAAKPAAAAASPRAVAPHVAAMPPQHAAVIATVTPQPLAASSTAAAAELRPAATASAREALAPVGEKAATDDAAGSDTVAATIRPGELSRHVPAYPFAARRRGIEGTVMLQIEVLPSGEAGRVEIAKSSGDESLDEAARDAAKLWRFSPAKKAGKPAADSVRVPYRFILQPPQ